MGVVTRYLKDDDKLILWRAYVWNDEKEVMDVYSSDVHTWAEIPQSGMQMMVRYYREDDGSVRTDPLCGQDLYFENAGGEDFLKTIEPIKDYLKFGTYIPTDTFMDFWRNVWDELEVNKPK